MIAASLLPILVLATSFIDFDHHVAKWFHQHLTGPSARLLSSVSQAGSGVWIGIVLLAGIACLARRRRWRGLISLILIVPGGMLLNEAVKILVHRRRPFIHGAHVDWAGYSFPSGHAIGATLLYGIIYLAMARTLGTSRGRLLAITGWAMTVALVAFSRVALGAHYLSDVIGAIILGLGWMALCRRVIACFAAMRPASTDDSVSDSAKLIDVPPSDGGSAQNLPSRKFMSSLSSQ